MKKTLLLCMAFLTVFAFCGCGVKAYVTIDGQGAAKEEMYLYSEEEIKELQELHVSQETIGEKTYKKYDLIAQDESSTDSIFDGSEAIIKTPTSFRMESELGDMSLDEQLKEMDANQLPEFSWEFYDLTVTMPDAIVTTNGTLSEDKKTVTFDLSNPNKYLSGKSCVIYAYTANAADVITTEDPLELKGLNKYGHLTKAKTLKINSLSEIKSISVNGKAQTSTKIKISKQGKYVIKLKNISKNKKFVVWYDKKKPETTVKPMTYLNSVKISFQDKISGIRSATLDKKTIKNGYVCQKKGSHKLILIDKAGNKTTVKFKIV